MGSDQARELRQQGINAAKAGNKDDARQLLQQSIRLEPNNEAAWLWLASVARDQRERAFCLQKILEINPYNDTAKQALAAMNTTGADAPAAPQKVQSLQKLSQRGQKPEEPAPAAPVERAAEPPRQPTESDILDQAPGIPMPSQERIADAQKQAEALIRRYQQPLPADVQYVHKTKRRAGEGDVVVLRLQILAAVVGFFVLLTVIGVVFLLTNEDAQKLVFAPTRTPSNTPTTTPTNTPGVTPTPSPEPRRSPTATEPPPFNLNQANPFDLEATRIYPEIIEGNLLENAINLLNRGEIEIALPTLQAEREAVETNFAVNPYYYEALAYLQQGDFNDALDTLDDAEGRLEELSSGDTIAGPLINSGFAQVYWALAQNALANGNTTQAQEYLDQVVERAEAALELNPQLAEPYILLARNHTRNREYDEAIEILDQGLEQDRLSNNARLLLEKGKVYFARRDYDLADYQAYLALYVDPLIEDAYQLQIASSLAQNDPGRAVLQAQNYLYYYPGSSAAFKLLGDARIAEGNFDQALIAYTQGLGGGTPEIQAETYAARAAIYSQLGRFDLARMDLTEALDLTDDPQIRALRMVAAYEDGRYAVVQDDVEALRGQGVVEEAILNLIEGRALVDSIDDTEGNATALYIQALNLLIPALGAESTAGQTPIVNEYIARAQLGTGDLQAAIASIDLALGGGETPMRHYIRGRILEALGNPVLAAREYEWVLSWANVAPFSAPEDVQDRLDALQER